MTSLIRGGRVITADDDIAADVLIDEHGVIAAVESDLDAVADRVIEADGCYVLPGCVDPHTHIETEAGGPVTCDDFPTGTAAAAAGGTTCILHFCFQRRGERLVETVDRWQRRLHETPPIVDVGFHIGVVDYTPQCDDDLERLADAGVTSIKLFLASPAFMVDDRAMFGVLQAASRTRSLVMVHAENGAVIDALVAQAVARGDTQPQWHARVRPPETEGEATNRAIQLAQVAGCPVYIVHVSCEEALAPIRRARERGQQVWGETCPQYLAFDERVLDGPPEESGKYIFIPPPRPERDQAALWDALGTDVLSTVGSDHCPYTWSGERAASAHDFTRIPPGAPGIEHRLHVVHHLGVGQGQLSLTRMVDLLSATPSRLFGLYPRKGTIAPGSDGDIVVFDPDKRMTLSANSDHSAVDYCLYEGMEVVGAPRHVLVRGRLVVDEGRLTGRPGDGSFVARARFGERLEPPAVVDAAGR